MIFASMRLLLFSFIFWSLADWSQADPVPTFKEIYQNPKRYPVDKVAREKVLRDVIYKELMRSEQTDPRQLFFIYQVMDVAYADAIERIKKLNEALTQEIAKGESIYKSLEDEETRLNKEIKELNARLNALKERARSTADPP